MRRHRLNEWFGAANTRLNGRGRRTLLIAGSVLLLTAPAVYAASLGASVKVPGSAAKSATLQLSSTANGSSCYSTGTGSGGTVSKSNSGSCTGGGLVPTASPPASALSTTATTASTSTVASVGTAAPTSSSVNLTSCGALTAADQESNDAAYAYGGVSFGQSGPTSSFSAVSFDGASGNLQTSQAVTSPTSFSIAFWFNTSTKGDAILGFTGSPDVSGTNGNDRMLWIDSSGNLVWAVNNGTATTGNTELSTSGTNYATGTWHFVVASVSSNVMYLSVDGGSALSTPITGASGTLTAGTSSYTGYWHFGWAYASNWTTDIPASNYFKGLLSEIAIIPAGHTAADIKNLYNASSDSAYAGYINGWSPTAYWSLQSSTVSASSSPTPFNAPGNSDTAAAVGMVTTTTAGPSALGSNVGAATFDGVSSYVQTSQSMTSPSSFAIAFWFKAPAGTAGEKRAILGFASSQTPVTTGAFDRMLWLDGSGHLVWGVNSGGSSASNEITATTTTSYADGNWHFVVAAVSSGTMYLSVDGATSSTSTSGSWVTPVPFTPTSSYTYTGYWHLGWANANGWTNNSTTNYFNGSLSEVAILSLPTTGAQSQIGTDITALYGAGSASAYTKAVNNQISLYSLTPLEFWPMQSIDACAYIEMTLAQTVGSKTTCLSPAGSGSCPTPTSSFGYGSILSAPGTIPITSPTASTPTLLKLVLLLDPGGGAYAGLDIAAVFKVIGAQSSFSSTLAWPNGELQL